MELKKPHPSRLVGEAEAWNGLALHPHLVDKIWEGCLGSEESQPHTRAPGPWFQCQEDKSPKLLAAKTKGLSEWKKLLESQAVPLKESTHGITQTHSL